MTDQNQSLSAAATCLLEGDPAAARAILEPFIAANPAVHEARYWLASTLIAQCDAASADQAMDDARTLHALAAIGQAGGDIGKLCSDGAYAAQIATTLYGNHHIAMASVASGRAIAGGNISAQSLLTYGLALQHQARAEEAIMVFRALGDNFPSPAMEQFRLYPHFLVEGGIGRYPPEAKAWAAKYAPPLGNPVFPNTSSKGRRLRIGYVAPTFAGSQLRQFITPVLENHDPKAVEIFVYPASGDTETIWPKHIKVRPIGTLSDVEAQALIGDDRIDVLIDLWGHAAGSRLSLFGRRAAPVQVSWMNYLQTTGIERMDYVMHTDSMAADGTDVLFTEQVRRTGVVLNPFRPDAAALAPVPTPALASGQMTFGSFNHPCKLSDATVAAWARIVTGTPGSKLVLKYRYFVDPVLQRVTLARFAGHGVATSRIEFRGHTTGEAYRSEFNDIDLALDPSPAPGGTTTLEALSNGVPVITLKGDTFYTRIGLCALLGCGLPELICEGWDAYVAKAIALAADFDALNTLRQRVRPGFDAGPYRDEAGIVRAIEAEFRAMYDGWREVDASAVA